MGRALYSKAYTQPVIRDPSPPQCEKWSINKPFDPDSDDFFDGAEYEAFLPVTDSAGSAASGSTTRTSSPNVMILDSVPHDLPDMDPPSLSASAPPVTMPELEDIPPAEMGSLVSPMAAGSDSNDPARILEEFVREYRLRSGSGSEPLSNISAILRRLDEEIQRMTERGQQLEQEHENQRQMYLPPLSYSSSSASSTSSRANSPSSPMLSPSPRPETPPSPPPMSRELDVLADLPEPDPLLSLEDTETIAHELQDSEHEPVEPVADDSSDGAEFVSIAYSSIPITGPQTPPRAIQIRRGAPGSFGHDVGMDMSPPPSVSPRLYNWSRTGPEQSPRFSPSSFTRRSYPYLTS